MKPHCREDTKKEITFDLAWVKYTVSYRLHCYLTWGVHLEFIMFTAAGGICRNWRHYSLHMHKRKHNCTAAVCQ